MISKGVIGKMRHVDWEPNHTFVNNQNGEREVAVLSYVTTNCKYTYTITEQEGNYLLTCNDKDWEEMLPPITFPSEKEAFAFVDFLEIRLTKYERNSANVSIGELVESPFFKELFGQIVKHDNVMTLKSESVASVWLRAGGNV
jgi:hypothetical protein